MLAYTSFISDVHKSYRVEKIVLHHLIFLLLNISTCLLVPNAILSQLQIQGFYMGKVRGIELRLKPINTN